jgi:hypothetical protein
MSIVRHKDKNEGNGKVKTTRTDVHLDLRVAVFRAGERENLKLSFSQLLMSVVILSSHP